MPDANPDVIVGRDGWLFLHEGTNRSLSYLTGAAPISPEVAQQWRSTIRRRQAVFPGCVHLVCPEKLAVFADFADGVVLDPGRFALRLAAGDRVLYPVEPLRRAAFAGAPSYPQTDSHFNELGAFVAAGAVLEAFGLATSFEPEWRVIETGGDLAGRVVPPRRSQSVALARRLPVDVHDNGVGNRGRILHLRSRDPDAAAAGRRLLICGDSFAAGNLARMMTIAFEEVLFVHSLAVDFALASRFDPHCVLFEWAERFLRSAPNDGLAIESLLIHKAQDGQAAVVRAWREDTANRTHRFVDWSVVDRFVPRGG